MISWWLPYLAKGPTPDFNYDPGNDSNSGCNLALQRLIESDLNNGPSPSHSNLVSDGVYICSGLLLMVSWYVPYLPKAAGLTSVMAQEMTGIVAPFCPPPRLFESDSNNAPSPSHSNLVQVSCL